MSVPSAYIKEINEVISHSDFKDFVRSLNRYLMLSKTDICRNDPVSNEKLQEALLQRIEEADVVVTQGRKIGKFTSDRRVEIHAKRNLLIEKMHRDIADGIAWRILDYNRAIIRVLSQAQSPGFAASPGDGAKLGRKSELRRAREIVTHPRKSFVIINDATTQFLVGDLIIVVKDKDETEIYLNEIKKDKKFISGFDVYNKVKDGQKVTKQAYRLLQAQHSISTKVIASNSNVAEIVDINIPVTHYLLQIRALLDEAEQEGFANIIIDKYLGVEVIDYEALLKLQDPLQRLKSKELLSIKNVLFPISNYDYQESLMTGEVVRSKPPYSIYPFANSQRLKLMSGEASMTVYLYKGALMDRLKQLGWSLTLPSKPVEETSELKARLTKETLFPAFDTQNFIEFTEISTGFTVKTGIDLLLRMASEFVSVEYIIQLLLAGKERVKKGESEYIVPNNLEEAKMWD